MVKANSDVSISDVRRMFDYSPDTGSFTWKFPPRKSPFLKGRIAGRVAAAGYVRIQVCGKSYMAHRLAWAYVHGEWPQDCIDHINGDRSDNRIANLRDVSLSTNQHNRWKPEKGTKSGLLGVHQSPGRSNWYAMIQYGGKNRYLGTFPTPEEAHAAYLAAKREHHTG